MEIVILLAYHFLFFRNQYLNPMSMARSELLSTFFPSWIHLGRGEKNDPYYWINYRVHPVLSAYYPPHYIGSKVSQTLRLGLNTSYITLCYGVISHHCLASLGWFFLISAWASPTIALFGAITLTYSAYNIKQQPCIAYTIAWFPWILYFIVTGNQLLAGISFGMLCLAGYYPIGIQITLICVGASILWGYSLLWVPIGLAIGSPQMVPFLRYLPKTIRTATPSDKGIVPLWHLISLLFPKTVRYNVSSRRYNEQAYYVGLSPLLLICASGIESRVWVLCVVSLLLMLGLFRQYLPRIPARWSFAFAFSLGWLCVPSANNLGFSTTALWCLIIIQAFDLLWHNSDLMYMRPYTELPNKPSWAFNCRLTRFLAKQKGDFRVSGLPYPLFTGHINRIKTLGYSGGMQLKLMAKWRGDKDPDGSGEHDWFRSNNDSPALDRYRVRFAYSRKKLDWASTGVRDLYENPRDLGIQSYT